MNSSIMNLIKVVHYDTSRLLKLNTLKYVSSPGHNITIKDKIEYVGSVNGNVRNRMIKEVRGMNITRCYIQSEATLTFMAAAGAPAFV